MLKTTNIEGGIQTRPLTVVRSALRLKWEYGLTNCLITYKDQNTNTERSALIHVTLIHNMDSSKAFEGCFDRVLALATNSNYSSSLFGDLPATGFFAES